MGTTTLSGGNKVATVTLGTNLTVHQFGTFGSGASPSDPAELDTLHFVGSGLTAANMVLTQNGTDVLITFEGIANTKVTLVDTTISALENIAGQGNFRFDGESQVTESIDVWNDARVTGTIVHADSVTYLNALNDTATGLDSSKDVIRGLDGDDLLKGLGGDDTLYGNAGDDRLNGGTGADQMVGGRGNDTYLVDDLGDKVVETLAGPDGGIDTVISSVDFTLGANVENLTLTSPFGSTGVGNALDNVITGGPGGSVLIGHGGNDTLQGIGGFDTLEGDAGDDTLRGGGGNDTLDGGTGNDLMVGGAGGDTYYVDSLGDQVVETLSNQDGGGIDIVNSAIDYTLGATLDFLVLTGQAVSGTGNASYNYIQGDDLANFLSGKGGDDNLFGMKGDDVLSGGAGNDAEHGGNGADALSGDNGDDSLAGEAGNDFLQGGIGNDSLDGGTGNDTMSGDAGNDIYYVDSIGDKVVETLTAAAGGGIDTVISSINYTLGLNVENLQLDGGLTGTGNSLDNTITGTPTAETLKGDGGNDRLVGEGGADKLLGDDGNDTLVVASAQIKTADGGTGVDTADLSAVNNIDLTGALGAALKSIEIVSMGSNGNVEHNLVLDSKAVDSLAAGGAFGDHALLVTGGIQDSVTIDSTWTAIGSITNPFGQTGTFNEFTSGDATLLVESGVAVGEGDSGSTPSFGSLNGSNGFRVDGAGFGAGGDHWLSNIGDLNGDGYADLIIGAGIPNAQGGAAVVLGHAGSFPATFDVNTMSAAEGFFIRGSGVQFGAAVGSAGDMNGDGFDDLIVGAAGGNGSAFVVFGHAGSFGSPDLFSNPLNGNNGFEIDGAHAGDFVGHSVAAAGDVNGDGYADIIIGAPGADPNGLPSAGSAYVVLGHAGGFGPSINVASLNGGSGFALNGATAGAALGSSVASAGDINGDGYADTMIAGAAVTAVVFGHGGPLSASIDLGTLDGSNGFLVDHGGSVSGVGDVNGDGIADFIIGNGVAVVFGHAGTFLPTVATTSLDGSNGFTFVQHGLSVSGAGDVNGDGYADLLVGDDSLNAAAGTSYVLFGHAGGFTNNLDLTKLTPEQGFRLQGLNAHDYSGAAVSAVGDVNGDGYADIAISAPGANSDASNYVVFGGNFTGAVSPSSIGTGAAEAFIGTAGDDVIYGGGGRDSFESGAGDDQIYIGSGDFRHIDGGGGIDTVFLDGAIPMLDLTGDLRDRITNVESISLYAEGANILKLDAMAVEAILGSNGAAGPGARTLLIAGDDSDTVRLEGQWLNVNNDVYQTFVSGGVTVEVVAHLHVDGGEPPPPDLASLDGDNGFVIRAPNGLAVAGAGDFNGDGYQDIVLGPVGNQLGGIAFGRGIPFGPSATPGENFTLTSPVNHTSSGAWAVAGLGDVNGDGYDDVILTNPTYNDINAEGIACVVFGSPSGMGTTQDMSAPNGTNGFLIQGTVGAELGWSAAAGDINGDGFADVIIGSNNAAANAPGAAYVLFGHGGAFAPHLTPADLDGTAGFTLTGASPSVAHAVASGDINGDGYADLIAPGEAAPRARPIPEKAMSCSDMQAPSTPRSTSTPLTVRPASRLRRFSSAPRRIPTCRV